MLSSSSLQVVVVIGGLLLIALAIRVLSKRGSGSPGDEQWPFYAKKPLSQPEQVLWHRLVKALPDHIVLAQVQLSRVLGVKKGFNFNEWNNRVNRMSLDFLVCRQDSSVVVAIELDDKSHARAGRFEADTKKDKALSAAGIALIRWNVRELPDTETIRKACACESG